MRISVKHFKGNHPLRSWIYWVPQCIYYWNLCLDFNYSKSIWIIYWGCCTHKTCVAKRILSICVDILNIELVRKINKMYWPIVEFSGIKRMLIFKENMNSLCGQLHDRKLVATAQAQRSLFILQEYWFDSQKLSKWSVSSTYGYRIGV